MLCNDTHAIFTFLRIYFMITYLIIPDDLPYKAGTTYLIYSEKLLYSFKTIYLIIPIILCTYYFFFIFSYYSHLLYYSYYTLYIIKLHIINN